ncbi:MAG: sulfurtransferase [Cellulomonas sp.]|nr:sulfurtransferase [Cellulomonas sp.]
MSAREQVLVTPAALAAELAGEDAPVLLDVRWALGRTDGREQYLAAHLPGAVFVDLDRELAGPATPHAGRHPLPDPAELQAAARRWGLRSGSRVVAYDASGAMAAARAWWLLRWAGLGDVRLLDGGLSTWQAAGLPVEAGEHTPVPGDVVLNPGALPTTDADGAATWTGVLLDARAGERFRGEVEPIDPRAGHVPGAVSAPTQDNLGPDEAFLPEAALVARFAGLVPPGEPVAVYCGSGVTAAHEVAALAAAGIAATLYPGSWSQWSADGARPVATGA